MILVQGFLETFPLGSEVKIMSRLQGDAVYQKIVFNQKLYWLPNRFNLPQEFGSRWRKDWLKPNFPTPQKVCWSPTRVGERASGQHFKHKWWWRHSCFVKVKVTIMSLQSRIGCCSLLYVSRSDFSTETDFSSRTNKVYLLASGSRREPCGPANSVTPAMTDSQWDGAASPVRSLHYFTELLH